MKHGLALLSLPAAHVAQIARAPLFCFFDRTSKLRRNHVQAKEAARLVKPIIPSHLVGL